MGKNIVKITESRLHEMIVECVKKVLKEGNDFDAVKFLCDNFYEERTSPEAQLKEMARFLKFLAKTDEPDYRLILNKLGEYRKQVEAELQLPENGGGQYTFDDYVGIHTNSKILDTVQVFLEDYKLIDLFDEVKGKGSFIEAVKQYLWS